MFFAERRARSSRLSLRALTAALALTVAHTTCAPASRTVTTVAASLRHSSTIALSVDERLAYLVQPDADRVSVVDTAQRALVGEIALGPLPERDAHGDYAPAVAPRSISISPQRHQAFVACERSGELVAIDLARRAVSARARVCARPVAALVSDDERTVYVSCAADDVVLAVDPGTLAVTARAVVSSLPWALALDRDPSRLYVAPLHGDPVVTLARADDRRALTVVARRALPENPPRGDRTLAHGLARSAYDLAVRPRGSALWVAHELHADDTAQPELDFESEVFPAVSVLNLDERAPARDHTLTSDSRLANRPGVRDGEFYDPVSGPRALVFTPDGRYALVLAQASEDLLVVDAARGVEHAIVRPLPCDWPQGIALTRDGRRAFVECRNSGTVVPLALERVQLGPEAAALESAREALAVRVDGEPFAARSSDPMAGPLRMGQRVFFTANDAEIPVTTNRWMACASCHPEGTTDRVTWRFSQGPRDAPSNAGGPVGFLFRTGARRDITEYWRTVHVEQGGDLRPDDVQLAPYLTVLRSFVQHAIPAPPPPTLDPMQVARGRAIFERPDTQCATCHTGAKRSDSGAGNPSLDLAGPVLLHDVGTCAPGDVAHTDFVGHPRAACLFDTTALVGLAESAPYLHDGSARTLRDVLTTRNPRDQHGRTQHLAPRELDDLVAFLRSL